MRSSVASRSVLHVLGDAAALLASLRLRPGDLAGAPAFARHGATLTAVGLAAARRSRHHTVLVDHLGNLDGAGLERAVGVTAAAIASAVRAADVPRVAVLSGDHRGFVAAVVAAGTLGVDVLLVGASVGTDRLATILARGDVAAVVHDAGTSGLLDAVGYRGGRIDVLALVASSGAVVAAGPVPRARRAHPRPRRAGRLELLTSGTTGIPHATTRSGVSVSQLPTVLSLLTALGLRRGEAVLVAPPLAHGHGLSVLSAALVVGSPVVIGHGRDPGAVLTLMGTHRVGVLLVVPMQLARLMAALDDPGAHAPALRRIATGSAPLSRALAARVTRRFGHVLVDFFGSSETGTATVASPADLRAAPGTVGRPATGVRIAVCDDTGAPVPVGVVGRVVVRSPWRAADTRRRAAPTGDLGRMDASGRLFLVGRTDDVVVVGGHNVHPGTVRDWVLRQHGVRDAVVRAEPDPELGATLVVRVAGTGLDAVALAALARAELGASLAPRRFEVVPGEA